MSERCTKYLKDNGLYVLDEQAKAAQEYAQKVKELEQLLKTIQESPEPR